VRSSVDFSALSWNIGSYATEEEAARYTPELYMFAMSRFF
jgi:hypothetical protein